MAVVEFKDFSWTYSGYSKPILNNIDLKVNKGDFLGIIGSVGSGRTTLCTSLLGLIPHFYPGRMKGKLIVDGLSVKESGIADLSTRVGLAFQSPTNQLTGAGMTVEEELAFGLENLGVPRNEMIKRVNETIKLIGLESFKKRSPYELSGGQQQKVAIASVLIMNPKILVLDEPTAQLDPLGTTQVFDLVKKLARKGITIILASNKVDYLAEFADRVMILDNRVVKEGPVREILTDINLLRKHNLEPSVLTRLSYELKKKGLWKGDLCLNLNDAKLMVKKVIK
jgi:energy-coupling factor transporter ATP-binding protein EcfA2